MAWVGLDGVETLFHKSLPSFGRAWPLNRSRASVRPRNVDAIHQRLWTKVFGLQVCVCPVFFVDSTEMAPGKEDGNKRPVRSQEKKPLQTSRLRFWPLNVVCRMRYYVPLQVAWDGQAGLDLRCFCRRVWIVWKRYLRRMSRLLCALLCGIVFRLDRRNTACVWYWNHVTHTQWGAWRYRVD